LAHRFTAEAKIIAPLNRISRDSFDAVSNMSVTLAHVASVWRLPDSGRFNVIVVTSAAFSISTGSAIKISFA
jgi:hypothetical protein